MWPRPISVTPVLDRPAHQTSTMKLLVLIGLLAALLVCAESSPAAKPCRVSKFNGYSCPYSPPHECGVPGKYCSYYYECCRGACFYECQPRFSTPWNQRLG